MLKATLIDNKTMAQNTSGLLLALFSPAKFFMSALEQQTKNETVYFKLSGKYGLAETFMQFCFAVPAKQIISDFDLKQDFEKSAMSEEKIQSALSWIKYAIPPCSLLALCMVWYFKYKN